MSHTDTELISGQLFGTPANSNFAASSKHLGWLAVGMLTDISRGVLYKWRKSTPCKIECSHLLRLLKFVHI